LERYMKRRMVRSLGKNKEQSTEELAIAPNSIIRSYDIPVTDVILLTKKIYIL